MGYTPPQLEVRKITGGYQIFPPTFTTGDDLTISSNGTDTYAKMVLLGDGDVQAYHGNSGALRIYRGSTNYLTTTYGATEEQIISGVNNADLYLAITGSGVIKFGTYTAGAATDSTGYITIKDAAGNLRKLMVQA